MDDNPKARGRKHRSNKNKYKPGGAHAPPHKTRPPSLESNWERYEQEKGLKSSPGSDFSVLANAPISHGSHFQFKSDKDIALEIKEASELFNLDLALLDKSLGTISFQLRSGIENDYFTIFCQNQKNNIDDYSVYVKGYRPRLVFGSDDERNSPTPESSVSPLHLEPPKSDEDNLEAWLDNILDN
ncbi:hypothetical protein TcasGA2_TC007780 [Tribolium castaneum]|uniref:Uncharacterized protein n=1 Tax=Tribolium castaneum TaxID=7070 RepID=D2A1V7_TRICA|nr:hypothetical protein TcasGA2_TC007780 [Tribolium castaneum]